MAVTHQLIKPLDLVYVKLSGVITLQEISEALRAYAADSSFHPKHRQLIDLRSLDDATVGMWEMSEYKDLYDSLFPNLSNPIPVAIVASSSFGKRLSRMYSLAIRGSHVIDLKLYNDLDAALEHLRVQKDTFYQHMQYPDQGVVIPFGRSKT
ncbi:hypothetical protein KO498_15115 [Lentibacter algarum]|uniref:hypothetical protein n=1 Tax=Lentibacter algarum TaxID=576131 RepID=UPI001C0991D4|nr:hypothetical protein [Lentibacter algarum]MBU2983139.1 hypothetical protein [Lentibacter algarum]